MGDHIHKLQFVERGGVQCETLGCKVYYSEEHILQILDRLANESAKDCAVCRGRGYNVDWNKNNVKCSTCNGTGKQ